MSEFDKGELNDLSQVGNSAKSSVSNTASSASSSARRAIQRKLRKKKLQKNAKKAKEKTEKTAKRTKRIITAVCSSTVGLAIVAVILVAVIIFGAISVAASSNSADGSLGAYSDTRERIVQLARAQKGNGGERYWNEINGGPQEWCAMYVRWLLKHVDIDTSQYRFDNFASCFMDEGLRLGGWHDRGTYTPQPGDIIVYGTSRTYRQHVGIVVECSDGYVTTNEGNTSGSNMYNTKVDEHRYPLTFSWILGYWEFPYPVTSTGTPGNINAGEAEQKVYRYFTAHGLSKAATCGIMGNIMQECSFNSSTYFRVCDDILNPSLKASGICMWTGGNFTRFARDCPNYSMSLDAQIEYLYQTLIKNDRGELPTSEKYSYGCSGCWSALKALPNTRDGAARAAVTFRDSYERPDLSVAGPREEYAKDYWDKVVS